MAGFQVPIDVLTTCIQGENNNSECFVVFLSPPQGNSTNHLMLISIRSTAVRMQPEFFYHGNGKPSKLKTVVSKKVNLQVVLHAIGLSTEGTKDTLKARLEAYLNVVKANIDIYPRASYLLAKFMALQNGAPWPTIHPRNVPLNGPSPRIFAAPLPSQQQKVVWDVIIDSVTVTAMGQDLTFRTKDRQGNILKNNGVLDAKVPLSELVALNLQFGMNTLGLTCRDLYVQLRYIQNVFLFCNKATVLDNNSVIPYRNYLRLIGGNGTTWMAADPVAIVHPRRSVGQHSVKRVRHGAKTLEFSFHNEHNNPIPISSIRDKTAMKDCLNHLQIPYCDDWDNAFLEKALNDNAAKRVPPGITVF